MSELKIIIVGGGLAGSCLANGLINSEENIKVAVFERDSEESNRSGYQIRLGSNALVGFRACLTAQQFDALMPCFGRSGGVISSAPALFNKNMELVLDLGKFPAYSKSAPIARARLREFLQAPLRERNVLTYQKKFVSFDVLEGEMDGEQKIRAHFDDGYTEECDILISAEGSSSRVNQQVGCKNIQDETKRGGFLGKCNLPWSVLQELPRPLIEKGSIMVASESLSMFSAAYLPDAMNSPAESDQIDGKMSDLKKPSNYDENQASLMCGVSWLTDPDWPDLSKITNKKEFMRDKVKKEGWHSGYLKMVDALDPDELYIATTRVATQLSVNWRRDAITKASDPADKRVGNSRVWLIGDAIHPMLPTRGMGANQALHDTADALEQLLKLARKKKSAGTLKDDDVRLGLQNYEQKMIPRAFGWVRKSAVAQLPDLTSWRGKVMLFFLRQSLHFIGAVLFISKVIGWKPKDDAPELP